MLKRSKFKTILVEEILAEYHENSLVILHMYTQNLNDGFNALFTKILQNFYKFYTFYKIMRIKISSESALDIVSMMLF